MLVLSRKAGEKIIIGPDVVVTVLENHGNRVRIGIEAPPDVAILRNELQSEFHDDHPAPAKSRYPGR